MRRLRVCISLGGVGLIALFLSSCTTMVGPTPAAKPEVRKIEAPPPPNYAARIPNKINTKEKVIVIDPNVHVWGAYDANGDLIKAGLATAGSNWCADIKRACRTRPGSFRIQSLGSAGCKSSIYPLPRGGAPMPYCMFFNGHQGLHGSYQVVEGNLSHGCVRLHVSDAQWIRFNFARIGTKVIVKPY